MAARIGPIAGSVDALTEEMRAARAALPRIDLTRLGPEARRLAERLAAALEDFNAQLAATNRKLDQLSRTPLLGMLGGGAEVELHKLAGSIDRLREAAKGWRELVSH